MTSPHDEQVGIRAGFSAWSLDDPVGRLDDLAAWLRSCADKVEANSDEWRSIDQPPDVVMADYLRDRAQAIDDYASTIRIDQLQREHEDGHPESGDSGAQT